MRNALVTKLQHWSDLTLEDRAGLTSAIARVRQVGADENLMFEGEKPDALHVVLTGFACRYKVLSDGRRQIIAFLVPGDFCDLPVGILRETDESLATSSPCSVATLTPCTIGDIPPGTIEALAGRHPRISLALWWAARVDESILCEWFVGIGRRSAGHRLAHLLCELHLRLWAVGHAGANGYDFPVTQEELCDTLGLSTVHVNRTLQQMRREKLITLKGKVLMIPDVARLREYAGFSPGYLRLPLLEDLALPTRTKEGIRGRHPPSAQARVGAGA